MKILIEESVLRQALDALEGINSICSDSRGVAGYHLNGDIAEWGEFDEMNQMDISIAALHTALDAATTVKKFVLGYVKQIEEQLAIVTKERDELVEAVLAVCCDPEGRVVIRGSDGDRAVLQAALAKLGADKTGDGS